MANDDLWEQGESLQDKLEKQNASDLDETKVRLILGSIYYSEFNKFSKLVEILPFSRGTVSKYLNKLKEDGILYKNTKNDRSVTWEVTNQGVIYMMYKDWINNDITEYEDLKKRKKDVGQFIDKRNLEKAISSEDIQEASEKFDFLKNLNETGLTEPEKAFLKMFANVDLSDYRWELVKKKE